MILKLTSKNLTSKEKKLVNQQFKSSICKKCNNIIHP